MTEHEKNLARVQALRDRDQRSYWLTHPAVLDHIEDVLTRHAPDGAEPGWPPFCGEPWHLACGVYFPCSDYASALALLDKLDGGTDD